MYVVTVQFLVHPQFIETFTAAVVEQAKNSVMLERDCDVFDVCTDPNEPTSFYLYEKYASKKAFQAHLDSEHFRSFDIRVSPWTAEKKVKSWTEIEVR